jgi:hypothetical protein
MSTLAVVGALGFIRFIRARFIDPNRSGVQLLEQRNGPPACFTKQGRLAFVACEPSWQFRKNSLLDAGLCTRIPVPPMEGWCGNRGQFLPRTN